MSLDTILQDQHDEQLRHEAEFIDHQWEMCVTDDVNDSDTHPAVMAKYEAYFYDNYTNEPMTYTEWLSKQSACDVDDWYRDYLLNN